MSILLGFIQERAVFACIRTRWKICISFTTESLIWKQCTVCGIQYVKFVGVFCVFVSRNLSWLLFVFSTSFASMFCNFLTTHDSAHELVNTCNLHSVMTHHLQLSTFSPGYYKYSTVQNLVTILTFVSSSMVLLTKSYVMEIIHRKHIT